MAAPIDKNFDPRLIPALDALLQWGSVTRAAQRLGIGQPTMSGILARLREQLGDPLLVRLGRELVLTERARALKPEIRQILLALEQVAQPQSAESGAFRREFTIMTSEFGLHLLMPTLFRDVLKLQPHLRLRAVAIRQPIASIFEGVADLCVTGDRIDPAPPAASRMLRTRALMHDDFVAVVDQAHPLVGPVTLADLTRFPRVAAHFEDSDHAAEDVGLRHLSTRYPPEVRVPSFLAIAPMVAATPALGLVPSLLAPYLDPPAGFRTLRLVGEFERIAIKLIWHTRHDRDPAHDWLRARLIAIARSIDPERAKPVVKGRSGDTSR